MSDWSLIEVVEGFVRCGHGCALGFGFWVWVWVWSSPWVCSGRKRTVWIERFLILEVLSVCGVGGCSLYVRSVFCGGGGYSRVW